MTCSVVTSRTTFSPNSKVCSDRPSAATQDPWPYQDHKDQQQLDQVPTRHLWQLAGRDSHRRGRGNGPVLRVDPWGWTEGDPERMTAGGKYASV